MLHSNALSKQSLNLNFKFQHYATIKKIIKIINENDIDVSNVVINSNLVIKKSEIDVVNLTLDSKCIISIIDRIFLANKILRHVIKYISQSIRVRNIDDVIISFFEYIYLEFVFNNTLKKLSIVDKMRRQIHIVNNLKINIFIDSNILDFKRIILDFVIEFFIIDSYCDIMISMNIISLCEKIHKAIRTYDITIVLSYSSIIISIRLRNKCKAKLSKNRNFIFMSTKLSNRFKSNKNVLNHITNASMCAIQVNNITNKSIIIEKNSRLNTIQKYKEKECYIVSFYYDYLVVDFNFKS